VTVDLAARWGSEVVQGSYAGHPGLVYEPRPATIAELLHGTERWADQDFLVQGGRRITHGAFRGAIPAAARRLAAAGVGAGNRVMLLAYNSPEFALAMWASWWLGAVPVFGNRWWSAQEIAHATAVTTPALVVTDVADPAALRLPVLPIAELADAYTAGPDWPEPALGRGEDDEALLLFTSGSSGAPKAVRLSQRSIIANQQNLLVRSRRLPQTLDVGEPQAVTLVCTPLFHIGGVSNILTSMLTGARLVLNEGRFDAGEVLALIEAERVQTWGGVPTMAIRVLEHPDFERHDLSSLRSFPLGGAPLPPSLLATMIRKLPQLGQRGLANTWGMTESGGFVTVAGNADLKRRPGTVGRPYACAELRIAEPDANGSGEILLRSPTVMLGYVGVDDGTLDADGWLHTGDLGHLDADGYLFLDGRSKDIVIRGGENIACAHVEAVLLSHPDVVEVAVFGTPHDNLGEELAAAVRHRPGAEVTSASLTAFLRERLAHFEVPSRWQLGVEPLPTLAGEKVDKKRLRAAFGPDA
jgi:long-chain acyl-CoA synthetase